LCNSILTAIFIFYFTGESWWSIENVDTLFVALSWIIIGIFTVFIDIDCYDVDNHMAFEESQIQLLLNKN